MSLVPDSGYDEECEPLVTRDGRVIFNPLQQSHHLEDEPSPSDPVTETTTTDQFGITNG